MTGKDIMPFGKWKGTPLEKVPRTYFSWLFDQDGTEEKFPDLFDWFCEGDVKTGTCKEINVNFQEDQLLLSMPTPFKVWWERQYGTNLRKVGSEFLIPYLRVASAAWTAAGEQFAKSQLLPKPIEVPRDPPPPTSPKKAISTNVPLTLPTLPDEEVDF